MSNLVKIDGGIGEGGGQVLRMAISISSLFGIPIEINNIRFGRPKPGLAAQHLAGVELIKEMCNAKVKGAFIGSTCLEFRPGKLQKNKYLYKADPKTAGCIGLLAQVAIPCALFLPISGNVTLVFKGGTNVGMGPQVEYLTEVLRPILEKFGVTFQFSVVRRGYFPRGGGELRLNISPVRQLGSVEMMDPGNCFKITGWSFVAGAVPMHEAYEMSKDAERTIAVELKKHGITVPKIDILAYKENREMSRENCAGINLVCETNSGCFFGGSGLKDRKATCPPGVNAANEVLRPLLSKSCVDEHCQDQLVIFMALAKGYSKISLGKDQLTNHTETAIQIAEILLASKGLKFHLTTTNGDNILECQGCGLENNF